MMQKCFLSLLRCLLGNLSVDVIHLTNRRVFFKVWILGKLNMQWSCGQCQLFGKAIAQCSLC